MKLGLIGKMTKKYSCIVFLNKFFRRERLPTVHCSHLIVNVMTQRWIPESGNPTDMLEGDRPAQEGAPHDQSSRRRFPLTVARELVKSASRDFLSLIHNVLSYPKEVPSMLNELEDTSRRWNSFEPCRLPRGGFRGFPADIYFFWICIAEVALQICEKGNFKVYTQQRNLISKLIILKRQINY